MFGCSLYNATLKTVLNEIYLNYYEFDAEDVKILQTCIFHSTKKHYHCNKQGTTQLVTAESKNLYVQCILTAQKAQLQYSKATVYKSFQHHFL